MQGSGNALIKQDFDQTNWQDLLATSKKKTCLDYTPLFGQKSAEARAANDTKAEQVFTLLEDITYPVLLPNGQEGSFNRPDIFAALTIEQLNVLTDIAPNISDPEMRARVADVLWSNKTRRRQNYQMAELAVDSYLEAAEFYLEPSNLAKEDSYWLEGAKRLDRAVRLGASLGRSPGRGGNVTPYSKAIAAVEQALDQFHGGDPYHLSADLMELLQEYKLGIPAKYAPWANSAAVRLAQSGHWPNACRYYFVQANWHDMAQEPDKARLARIDAAEVLVNVSQKAIAGRPQYGVAARFLKMAIEMLRQVGQAQPRVDQLHHLLLDYEEKAVAQMGRFGVPINVSGAQAQAKARVVGKKVFEEALWVLVSQADSPRIDNLRKGVEQAAQQLPLTMLAREVVAPRTGKTVGVKPSVLSGDPNTREAAIQAQMFWDARIHQAYQTITFIDPIRDYINTTFPITEADLLPFMIGNLFVPQGRERIYAKGFLAGFSGNWLVAAHLLIPQLEESIRQLLYQQGVILSTLIEGLEQERDLNVMLSSFRDKVTALLGDDPTFDLRGLMTERFGSNLRNRLAHGLMDYDSFSAPQVQYLWWLTLRICLAGKLGASITAPFPS